MQEKIYLIRIKIQLEYDKNTFLFILNFKLKLIYFE